MLEIPIGVAEFLDTPMDRWRAFADAMYDAGDRVELDALARDLSALAETVARAASYVRARGDGFHHRAAVAYQNHTAAAVRRALRYTHPRRDITF